MVSVCVCVGGMGVARILVFRSQVWISMVVPLVGMISENDIEFSSA